MIVTSADFELHEVVHSTQELALERVATACQPYSIAARHQTRGRGRFGRVWSSQPGECLCISLALPHLADHKQPWLIGMAIACAAAGVFNTRVRWPNDLCIGKRKVGGILTELLALPDGRRIPVVGIGINLTVTEFPEEFRNKATSLQLEGRSILTPIQAATLLMKRLEHSPVVDCWSELFPVWELYDDTPGKHYELVDGRIASAINVGPEGELLCSVDGETVSVLAATAHFGDLITP